MNRAGNDGFPAPYCSIELYSDDIRMPIELQGFQQANIHMNAMAEAHPMQYAEHEAAAAGKRLPVMKNDPISRIPVQVGHDHQPEVEKVFVRAQPCQQHAPANGGFFGVHLVRLSGLPPSQPQFEQQGRGGAMEPLCSKCAQAFEPVRWCRVLRAHGRHIVQPIGQ